jgi:hypothetical protein
LPPPSTPRVTATRDLELEETPMKRYLGGLLLATLSFSVAAHPAAKKPDPWTEWFQRASDQMDLRTHGSTPFHLKAVFHAFPGVVFSKKESEQIISGDGTYEETWLTPTRWRREVNFGSYHAVEVESETGRRMQASSDYEPSRVLMLLEALLYPVPRDLYSPSLADEHYVWKIEMGAAGSQSYVKISTDVGNAVRAGDAMRGYLFLPSGELLQSIERDFVTNWTNPTVFAGKLVPRQIQVLAGTRDLLTAAVTIEAAGAVDGGALELPGPPAEPGMTLRPLHKYEVHGWDYSDSFSYLAGPEGAPRGAYREILDRHGAIREVELIYSPYPGGWEPPISHARKITTRPPTIDKSPCQIALTGYSAHP